MHSPEQHTQIDPGPIALCLSGGGFRATFFHLGVIRLLAEIGWLRQVRYVFSVSGGSILAGHMAVNWKSYLSSDEREFRRASDELVRFGQFDLRGRIVRRFWLRKAKLLQRYYELLYKGARLKDLPNEPDFYFLATSLTSGQLWSLNKEQWTAVSLAHHGPSLATKPGSWPLAQIVAASSAFPPLFPPIKFEASGLRTELEGGARLATAHYLTDGGIFDNLGVAGMYQVIENLGMGKTQRNVVKGGFTGSGIGEEKGSRVSRVVVSDASAVFEYADPGSFWFVVSRTIRSMDILMARLAERDLDEVGLRQGGGRRRFGAKDPVRHLSIEAEIESFKLASGDEYQAQPPDVQRAVKFVRTDLDEFDADLIRCLVRHGHEVAAHDLRQVDSAAVSRASPTPWDPWPEGGRKDAGHLVPFLEVQRFRFRKRKFPLGLFNVRDPLSWVYAVAIIAVLGIGLRLAAKLCGIV